MGYIREELDVYVHTELLQGLQYKTLYTIGFQVCINSTVLKKVLF